MSRDPASDPLEGFLRGTELFRGVERDTYTLPPDDPGSGYPGTSPAVIVMTEMPGITPPVLEFARKVADRGMTVVLPQMFGTPGRPMTPGYTARSLAKGCVAREFTAFATETPSPITDWLTDLARALHARHGGPGVGAVGMCFTGGFALAMMVDPVIVAPVLSQPSLPFAITGKQKRDLGITADQLRVVRERVANGCPVLGLRFSADKLAPTERFDRLRQELGTGFIAVEIDSSKGNPHGLPAKSHGVLGADFRDERDSPTVAATDQVLEFLANRLRP